MSPVSTRLPSLGPRGEGWVAIQFALLPVVVGAGYLGPAWAEPIRMVTNLAGALLLAAGGALAWASGGGRAWGPTGGAHVALLSHGQTNRAWLPGRRQSTGIVCLPASRSARKGIRERSDWPSAGLCPRSSVSQTADRPGRRAGSAEGGRSSTDGALRAVGGRRRMARHGRAWLPDARPGNAGRARARVGGRVRAAREPDGPLRAWAGRSRCPPDARRHASTPPAAPYVPGAGAMAVHRRRGGRGHAAGEELDDTSACGYISDHDPDPHLNR
jgi:hypothetical protein